MKESIHNSKERTYKNGYKICTMLIYYYLNIRIINRLTKFILPVFCNCSKRLWAVSKPLISRKESVYTTDVRPITPQS